MQQVGVLWQVEQVAGRDAGVFSDLSGENSRIPAARTQKPCKSPTPLKMPWTKKMSLELCKGRNSMNLESVLGESLQHYGIKRNVPFTNRTGSNMNVNFEVKNTKRAILSVQKAAATAR